MREDVESKRIEAESKAARTRLHSEAEAESIRAVEEAKVGAEQARMTIYSEMPQHTLTGLALQEMAKNIGGIEHLSLSPELLGPLLQRFIGAGTRKLEAEEA